MGHREGVAESLGSQVRLPVQHSPRAFIYSSVQRVMGRNQWKQSGAENVAHEKHVTVLSASVPAPLWLLVRKVNFVPSAAPGTGTHFGAVCRHSGCDIRGPILLQQVDVDLGPVPSVHAQQAEQLIDVVVNSKFTHDFGSVFS